MTDIEKLACARTYEQNIIKLTEEVGEMQQAISKCYEEETPETRAKVIEEMADSLICMDVIKCILRISEKDLAEMWKSKMARNMQRIGEAKGCRGAIE